ncbi:hypothetical protein [Curtobacterium sp. VKM Ac-2852]|uniref:hypothetical protein n=1 Tax=Curtobacterium sp. VKM Ac-2852 TaxID=2739024 RepID=UPI0015667135|nr:hypothetical protein [Curtobacterium sp. VKM Ac-2852]NQX22725.1 hypothetical protein [Curtobacterium sp. VKM Ac-2852]
MLKVVRRTEPTVRYTERELLAAVSRLVHFAYVKHIPLEDTAVFAPRTVERFVQHHLASYNRASRNTIRARLRRVSEALLGEGTATRYRALGKADASRPYSDKDISLLRAWGRSMRTDELTSSAGALLALGFGAGLTGSEIIRQRIEDIHVTTFAVRVSGASPRSVPLTGDVWKDLLLVRREVLGGSGWAFRSEQRGGNINLITDFVSRTGPQIPLVTRRMRATWLVGHLNAATPLKQLLHIAGLQSAEALDRVLPFADD